MISRLIDSLSKTYLVIVVCTVFAGCSQEDYKISKSGPIDLQTKSTQNLNSLLVTGNSGENPQFILTETYTLQKVGAADCLVEVTSRCDQSSCSVQGRVQSPANCADPAVMEHINGKNPIVSNRQDVGSSYDTSKTLSVDFETLKELASGDILIQKDFGEISQ